MSKRFGIGCSRIAILKNVSERKIAEPTKAIATRMLAATTKLAVMATAGGIMVTGAEDIEWLDTGTIK
ncbi:hypothetical protein [Mesorhizobium sp. L2C084A000]|uniref:hypothetical protein n=1 Tax=Mesorhizobium sp. L2C084A000 TaxID=1287116 RepID=UPI0003CFB390|nr:hypothetical protein [Mesorhizobium sp. L2C084A000]ESZ24272.1 hypothetical protein X734_23650 [Mesorhizobium sp. L2C084A000]